MYLRFVTTRLHPDSQCAEGPFGIAYDLRDDPGPLSPAAHAELVRIVGWFNVHLPIPDRLTSSRSKGYYRRKTRGLSWFKPTADEPIAVMRSLAAILEEHGHPIFEIQERRPGYIVYEDEFQIVAEPFRDTRTR